MALPREDAITEVMSITCLQREEASRWLKAHDDDANKAVNAYFENPNANLDQQSRVAFDEQKTKLSWNESQFHTDKTDAAQYSGTLAADALRPSVFNDSAPSRPPSRVSTRAGMGGHGFSQSLGAESEDEQMKRAMAISMGDSQTLPDQEIGVVERKAFGPATREHYETEKWAMTVPGPQTQEILLNPEPADRKRPMGAPAFIKPSPAGHHLPALIKILHTIPMAREALLNRHHTLPDYGFQKDWWEGNAIQFLRVINLDLEGRQTDGDDMIFETQRLIAFLDDTKRAYGSTDAVLGTISDAKSHLDRPTAFLEDWSEATTRSTPNAPLVDIFKSKGIKLSTESPRSQNFYCLKTTIDEEISSEGLTLYDVLDHLLWTDIKDGEETFLEKVGEIFAIEVCNSVASSTGIGMVVPTTWYADRYLPSSTEQVRDMLSRKAAVLSDLDAKEKAQVGMTQYTSSMGQVKCDGDVLLSKATEYLENTAAYYEAMRTRPEVKAGFTTATATLTDPVRIARELKALSERVSRKLQGIPSHVYLHYVIDESSLAFKQERESTREKLREISKMYTAPSDELGKPPYHKYTLRGVSTTSHTVYVLEKARFEDGDGDDLISMEATHWQWWKVEYVSYDSKPVRYDKVTEVDVLEAASTDSPNVLLVYASEAAVSHRSEDLPPQLRNFVRADNLTFSTELEGSAGSPTKRKAETDGEADDVNGHNQRSPPFERTLVDSATSMQDEDQIPPKYMSGSFDDTIPTSLRDTADTGSGRPPFFHQDGIDEGLEMQERDSGRNLLRRQEDNKGTYTLGSYKPQISMEVDEQGEDWRGGRGG